MRRVLSALCACVLLLLTGCTPRQSSAQTNGDRHTCTLSICCTALLDNSALDPDKAEFVPSDGYILRPTDVAFSEGDSVYDVLRSACADHVCTDNCVYCRSGGIQMESVYTPGYGTYYVEGIHQLYEKDCGAQSGWIYLYNGHTADKGCSEIAVHNGDVIEWVYQTQWQIENDGTPATV